DHLMRKAALIPRACLLLCGCAVVGAQERVTPENAKGGVTYGQPWAEVPESFRQLKIPEWPIPDDLRKWQTTDRLRVREVLLECLGEMPPRPDPHQVRIVSREDHEDYVLERFEFYNGVDMVVPGILAIPKNRTAPLPAVIGMHGHSGSKRD